MHQNGEISVRDRSRAYKGGMFAAYPGDIVFSKMGARDGAIGVLQQDIPRAVVTSEFPVFAPESDRLDGAFARLALRTGGVLAALGARTSGSGRKRVSPEAFADLRVPLPPLPRQRAIAAAHRAAMSRAADMEREADEIEARAMAEFEAALGFAPPAPLPDRPVFVASFKELDRWSHEGILRDSLHIDTGKTNFPIVKLGVVGQVRYGIQKSPSNRPGQYPRPYLRVANVQRWRLDLTEIKLIDVSDKDMPKYRLEKGDILLCEGNSADLVGRGAIWNNDIPECVHQNHVLRTRIDIAKAIPEFVLAAINSGYGQDYFRTKAKRTTNLASINSKEVSDFPLPLPPLDKQIS